MSDSLMEVAHGVAGKMTPVGVVATARLHMGFFDLNGELGRRFGSLGVSLDGPVTALHATHSDRISASGPGAERAIKVATQLIGALKLQHGIAIQLTQQIPEHAGLGSGTQMSLAVATALSRLYALDLSLPQVAQLTQRGARSGIGLGTFDQGGFVVDGGRAADTIIPPMIARMAFPASWRIVLIFDHGHTGVHGAEEVRAFQQLPPFPAQQAAILCRHVLMQALPALAEHDLVSFGHAIRAIQESTGDYFAPAQGGRYTSAKVAAALAWLGAQGVGCLGQSSWGPTSFAVFADNDQAVHYLHRLQAQFAHESQLQFKICQARNQGAVISD